MSETNADLAARMAECLLEMAELLSDNLDQNVDFYREEEIQETLTSIEKITDKANRFNDIAIDATLAELREVVGDIEKVTAKMQKTLKRIRKFEDIALLTLKIAGVAIAIESGAGIAVIAKTVGELVDNGKKVLDQKTASA